MDAYPATASPSLPSTFLNLIVSSTVAQLRKLSLVSFSVDTSMPQRITFDDSALPRSWRPEAIMPGSFDDDWMLPVRVRRAPTPWAKLAPLDEREVEEEKGDEAVWTLPQSPLEKFKNIEVTLDDIAAHAARPQPRPSRHSLRSISVSSTSSLDSISTLLSDLDESIASWQSCSDASSASGKSLRRRQTPRSQSLRDIRTKQSEMQLQQAYENSAQSYLDGSIYSAFTPPPLRPRNPARLSARYSMPARLPMDASYTANWPL